MTFPVAQRPKRSRKAVLLGDLPTMSRLTITRSYRVGNGSAHPSWLSSFLLTALVLCAGCTPITYSILRDPPDYVDRVLEDVTAIVEGMANAHAADRIFYHAPGIRSSL